MTFKRRATGLAEVDTLNVRYLDLGRKLENNDRMQSLVTAVGKLVLFETGSTLVPKKNPGVVYVLGTEIRKAKQLHNLLALNTFSTDDLIEKIKQERILPGNSLEYSLIARLGSVSLKQTRFPGKHEVRLRLKHIPQLDGKGSVLYDERHIIQHNLGILRPINGDNSVALKPNKLTLLLGSIDTNEDIDTLRIEENLSRKLIAKQINLTGISSYDAFKSA